MKTTCDAEGEICIPCQKQDFKCIRTSSLPQGPPQQTHQRSLVSLFHRAETKSKSARWAKDSEVRSPDPATKLSKMDSATCLPPYPSTCRLAEDNLPVVSPKVNEHVKLTSLIKDTPTNLNNQHTAFHSSGFCLEPNVTKAYLPPSNPNCNTSPYPLLSFPSAPTQLTLSIRKRAQRATQACYNCRNAQAKCNEGRPCIVCKEKGIDCIYWSETPPPLSSEDNTYPIAPTQQLDQARRMAQRSCQACNNCRSLKYKCDEGRPGCITCKEKGVDCVYRPRVTEAEQGNILPPVRLEGNTSPYPLLSFPAAPRQQRQLDQAKKKKLRAAEACISCHRISMPKCDEGRPDCAKCKEQGVECIYQSEIPTCRNRPEPYVL